MTALMDLLASGYPAELASAMVVNFRIGAIAFGIGLVLGVLFIVLQMAGGIWHVFVTPIINLMRAAPTFVVMFFLLNIIPRPFMVFGVEMSLSASMIVALSLAPYAAAYFADNGRAAVLGLQGGSQTEALLFLPNLIRAYVVLVMSSSAGVAIGVQEGVAVVLKQAELQATHGERILVFAVGVFAFGAIFQVGFAVVRTMVWYLSRKLDTREAS